MRFEFREGVRKLRLAQFVYIESNLHKLIFHLPGEKAAYTINERLDTVEEMMQTYRFTRIYNKNNFGRFMQEMG